MDKKEIKRELALRELSNRKLDFFTKYTNTDYQMIATQNGRGIHQQIIDKLEAVERGEIKRLMIFCPPRTGKSELVSIRFPMWCLGRNQKRRLVISSYGADLASDFGRKGKQVVQDREYMNIFPEFALSKDKKEWGNWETSKWGGVYTVGVGGALTGKGFDIGIIDDPVKDRMEAESPTIQQRVIDWYTSTFYTRRMTQDSAIIVMMTRWNVNDLAGYLLKEQQNGWDKWEILNIPAIDEDGHPIIWDGKWDENYFDEIRSNVSKKDFAALYQQDPIASSSNIFSLSNIRYFLTSDFERADGILKKDDLKIGIFVDPAFSSSGSSDDAVVMAVWKHRITGNYYKLDWYADTSAPSRTFIAILSMYDRLEMDWYKPWFVSIESVSLSKDQAKFIEDFKVFLKEKDRYMVIHTFEPKWMGKKEDRIKFILEPKTSLNAIYLRKDMPDKSFVRRLEEQLVDFPNGKHDDIIDCLAQAIYVLDTRWEPKQEERKPFQLRKKYFDPIKQRWITNSTRDDDDD